MNRMSLVPNAITIARLLAAPLVFWLIVERHMTLAFWLFIAAGLSDGVDGAIARAFSVRSRFGAWLDPIADKALLVGAFVALGLTGLLPLWLVALAVVRDLVIMGGVATLTLLREKLTMQPLVISKLNTLCQIVLASLVLAVQGLGAGMDMWIGPAILVTGLINLASLIAYLLRGNLLLRTRRQMQEIREGSLAGEGPVAERPVEEKLK
jgi:cardiolipin synthase (CMP-forming)